MRFHTILAALPLALAAPSRRIEPAPLFTVPESVAAKDRYIVQMNRHMDIEAMGEHISLIASDVSHTYSMTPFSGFAASMTADEVEVLRSHPDVERIEQDQMISIQSRINNQTDADWGLARISSSNATDTRYRFDDTAGKGVCAYIVDSGIDRSHPDFQGRVHFVKSVNGNEEFDHYHGTHIAGILGSATWGVAKNVDMYSVKVVGDNGTGSMADLLTGINEVAKDIPKRKCPKGVVVNLSLGTRHPSLLVNGAAAALVEAGHFVATAAGNYFTDASVMSPASEPLVCTVAATEEGDFFADYSDFGPLVDLLAPGTRIKSTYPNNMTVTSSGTSQASPHVAGLAAYFLGLEHPPAKPSDMCDYLKSIALKNVIHDVPVNTPNLFANNGIR
ncbi:subtilisin-like protease PR1K [Xylariaceae sp. FL1272]|nr:subtilisin-like protease PR1K [Xylariaceae sp. FL1272]